MAATEWSFLKHMKIIQILIYACSLLIAFPVRADTVLACQYTESAGFIYKNEKWVNTQFIIAKPFFIKLTNNGFIDESSLQSINIRGGVCKLTWSSIDPEEISCYNTLRFLRFNTKTLEGSVASLGGSVQTGNERDTIAISLFNCQKM